MTAVNPQLLRPLLEPSPMTGTTALFRGVPAGPVIPVKLVRLPGNSFPGGLGPLSKPAPIISRIDPIVPMDLLQTPLTKNGLLAQALARSVPAATLPPAPPTTLPPAPPPLPPPTGPRRPRGEKRPIPEEQKDARYFQRRRRNNLAAKKSRDQRKLREDHVTRQAAGLEQENSVLRAQLGALREEVASLQTLYLAKRINQQQRRAMMGVVEAADCGSDDNVGSEKGDVEVASEPESEPEPEPEPEPEQEK